MSHSLSDACGRAAGSAEDAQLLRGVVCFGAVVFSEKPAQNDRNLVVDPGHTDCLPVSGQGWWRDPAVAVSGDPA